MSVTDLLAGLSGLGGLGGLGGPAGRRSRRGTVRRQVHVAASTAQALYLPAAAVGLGTSGVIIGKELYSGRGFIYDPFTLYGDVLPGPNALVAGETGNGKSALVKSYCIRQVRFGRQVAVLSVKRQHGPTDQPDQPGQPGLGERAGEDDWAAPTRAVGGVVVTFRPGGQSSCINPLDPAIPAHLQLWLVRAMVEAASAPLGERALYALKVARKTAVTAAGRGRRVATLPAVAVALLAPSAKAAAFAFPEVEEAEAVRRLVEVGRDVALALDRLCDPDGDLAGMLDGPTRIRLAGTARGGLDALLAAPMVDFDLSLVNSNGPALPVLMAVLGTWLNHAWLRADGVKRLLVVEEAWMLVATAQMAALFEELLKFARGLGLSLVAVVHHLSDLADSTESEALLKMASTRVLYQMKAAEAAETGRRLGLPAWAVESIPTLQRGVAVWDVAGNCQLVQHVTTAAERTVVYSDSAMLEQPAARS